MKRLLSIFLVMLLLLSLSLQVSAQTAETTQPPQTSAETPTATPTETTAPPVTEVPEETPSQPSDPPSTEPLPEDPTEQPPEETTTPVQDPSGCAHSWVYVEVDPTCTEYGAKGYVCILCEALSEAEAIDLLAHTYDHSCDPSCNVCGSERSVIHKFSSSWSKNSSQHWHACSVCGEKNDVGSHYPGPAATEEKAQYCLTCGLMMMPKKAHTHNYSGLYAADELEHWYTCDGCEERKNPAPHSYDNPCDSECNICGYRSEKEHHYDSRQFDEKGHWAVCSLCGFSTDPEPHLFSGQELETEIQTCSVCDYVISGAPEHAHRASGDWSYDENSHWQQCECGEKTEEQLHIWDEGTETEEMLLHTCTVCGAEKNESLPVKPVAFPWWIPVVIVVLICAALAGMILLIVLKKTGKL